MKLPTILSYLIKLFLIPFSFLYTLIMYIRNKLYDLEIISSIKFDIPIISIGNLSTGGTGKTPHIEYLLAKFKDNYKIATMSRGYKRKTKGFVLADENADARVIGDEPMQFYTKYPEVAISVCEQRITGIPRLLGEQSDVEVILLDDAFQHRSVRPGLNILITEFNKPYYKDYVLPLGSLREARSASKRSDLIIVSKCPADITQQQQKQMIRKIKPKLGQEVFFTKLVYEAPYLLLNPQQDSTLKDKNILLIAGIANPDPLLYHLKNIAKQIKFLPYPDHHFFSLEDITQLKSLFDQWPVENKIILTTEKDAARLLLFKNDIQNWNIEISVLPVKVAFIQNENIFLNKIKTYIQQEKVIG